MYLFKGRGPFLEGYMDAVAYPGILFVGGKTNPVEGRGQRERGSGDGSQGFWRQL